MGRIATLVFWFCLLTWPAAAATGDGTDVALPRCPVPSGLSIPDGYLTGADIADSTEVSLRGYLIGFINGLQISVVMGARPNCIVLMHSCIANRDLSDLTRQLVLYVRERPEMLKETADVVTFNAIFGKCVTEIL